MTLNDKFNLKGTTIYLSKLGITKVLKEIEKCLG